MNTGQNEQTGTYNSKQGICSDESETKRKRLYSRHSHESEVSCLSQETATTRLSSETDSDRGEGKRSNGRSVSFSLANENEETTQDSCNGSQSRGGNGDIGVRNNISSRGQTNTRPYNNPNDRIYESLDNDNEYICQERILRQNLYPMANSSRRYSQNSFGEGNCRQPLLRSPSTYSGGTINEHSNDSEHGSGYAEVQGTFKDPFHQCVCTFDHNQCKKVGSSVKVLKRFVLALCVFNIILLIALIIVPAVAVIYIQASKDSSKDSSPGTIQSQISSEQQRNEPSCVKCQSLMEKFRNFIKTQKVIESMGNVDGRCCFSDPGKLMTILNQISTEAIEIAKSSVCTSCPSETNGREIKPAVHLKSSRNGLINASMVFARSKKDIESTHFVGWQHPVASDYQGLWGHLDENNSSVKVISPGIYFIYAMIQYKAGTLKSSSSDNMTRAASGEHHAPLKVNLYKCLHGTDGEKQFSSISQMYYSTNNRVQHNTYFGRFVYLKKDENVYLGVSGYDFIHQESDSHYLGLYKI